MGKINVGRVIAGGLVAGLIINIVESVMNFTVLADLMRDLNAKMGVGEPGGGAIAGYILLGFVLGFLVAWTYAAVRPRLGAGPATAAKAGLVVWLAACAVPTVSWHLMGAFGAHVTLIVLAYTLVEMVVAALAAGVIYKEHGPAM
jgi:hypothetical protein